MIRRVNGLVLVASLCAGAGWAQGGTHIGLGVPFNPSAIIDQQDNLFLPVGFGNLTIPVVFGGFRVEPEIGLLRLSDTYSSGGSTYKSTTSSLRVGVALHRVFGATGGFRAYAGPRVGIIRETETQKYSGSPDTKTRTQHWYFGAALGGEYGFSPHLFLGAEAHLLRIAVGDEEQVSPPPGGPLPDHTSTIITTNGLIVVRFYP